MLHEMFGVSRFVFNNTLGKIQESYFGTYEVQKAQNGKNKGSILTKIKEEMGSLLLPRESIISFMMFAVMGSSGLVNDYAHCRHLCICGYTTTTKDNKKIEGDGTTATITHDDNTTIIPGD